MYLSLAHLPRMPHAVKADERTRPVPVVLPRSAAVPPGADHLSHPISQTRLTPSMSRHGNPLFASNEKELYVYTVLLEKQNADVK
jgi:hypothetical protein